jgi:hypothetical protein
MLQSCTRQSAYSVEDYANPNLNGFNSISDLASGIDCPDAGIALFRSSHCEFASHWPIKHPDKHGCVGIRGACLMPTFREPKGHSWVQDCPSGNQNRDPGTKVCQFASPEMAKRGEGAIVNLSTIAADYGAPGMSLYGSSKAAINLLTKTWAAEYGPKGVRVNAVSPGPTRTEGTDAMGEGLEQLAAQAPAGRPATAEEIAEAIVFLATDRASFIHGAKLAVDGGRTAV